ncbi:hypothetical protein RHMOL_Rhmol04G0223500 [Rhododendron molle]|uniref:Uncharacterized protein n=1 Tax=Rhododendron molle TaxID=49168 RepID=A0ACC0P4S6_RHOML|nr:hypothetical protein RHMOL_Rhmol04G0223500 [Rhododendron molle]
MVWSRVLRKNNISRGPLSLHQELIWASAQRKGKSFCSTVYKLSLAATSYFLWGERNMRIFQNKSRDVVGLAAAILDAIRVKLCSFNSVKFSCLNRQICDDWLLSSRVFRINNG